MKQNKTRGHRTLHISPNALLVISQSSLPLVFIYRTYRVYSQVFIVAQPIKQLSVFCGVQIFLIFFAAKQQLGNGSVFP